MAVDALLDRYDPEVFDPGRDRALVRLEGMGEEPICVELTSDGARVVGERGRADAVLRADAATWARLARDLRGGMDAFRAGRLRIRRDLHLGVGFLAATSGAAGGEALRFRHVQTRKGRISTMESGTGAPVLLIHGLGGTKASFLPTVAALGRTHRAIAVDLPGFGDSDKPLRAAYDPRFFARSMVALLDALELDRADLVGNSMGGRVAIELALEHADRVGRLGLLSPSLAWLRDRPWAPLLRLVPPHLGAIQPAPRALVEGIARRAVGAGADDPWVSAGLDEFLRAYLTRGGRAAFYAAARNIYLEEPHGPDGFWTRLRGLHQPSLWVWGERDTLVPIRFARHVRAAVPGSEHLELTCGHVPQLERPRETHAALARFLG